MLRNQAVQPAVLPPLATAKWRLSSVVEIVRSPKLAENTSPAAFVANSDFRMTAYRLNVGYGEVATTATGRNRSVAADFSITDVSLFWSIKSIVLRICRWPLQEVRSLGKWALREMLHADVRLPLPVISTRDGPFFRSTDTGAGGQRRRNTQLLSDVCFLTCEREKVPVLICKSGRVYARDRQFENFAVIFINELDGSAKSFNKWLYRMAFARSATLSRGSKSTINHAAI